MTVIHHGCGGHIVDGSCKACGKSTDGQRQVPTGALQALDQARAALRDTPTPTGYCLVAESFGMDLATWTGRVELCECGSCASRRRAWNADLS